MKAETADHLAEARATLKDAEQIAALPLPHIAAREAYLAVFHAAEACIFEQTGKAAKTHRGVRSEFVRLAKAEPRIGRDLATFLGTAYQFKTRGRIMPSGRQLRRSPQPKPTPQSTRPRQCSVPKRQRPPISLLGARRLCSFRRFDSFNTNCTISAARRDCRS